MKKQLYSFILFLSATLTTFSQVSLDWQRSLGSPGLEFGFSAYPTQDGGVIAAGYSDSTGGDITGNYGEYDYWIVKLDSGGFLQWQKNFGGSEADNAYKVIQTSDSGYLVAGRSNSNDSDVTGNHGFFDYWIVKTDTGGNIQWQKSLGGSGWDDAKSVQQTTDGGYILAGYSESSDGDATSNYGFYDFWIVRISSSGTLQWQKSFGGTDDDEAYAIHQTYDGGFVAAGSTLSNDSDVTGNHGDYDYWIIKMDSLGNLEWQKTAGGSSEDIAYSVIQSPDSGYLVAGYTLSTDGDVTGNHGLYDYWVIKLDGGGNLLWQKCFGGTGSDYAAEDIEMTPDSGFLVIGGSNSTDGDVTGNIGDYDFWLVKMDATGTLTWEKSFGGTNEDYPYEIRQFPDGDIVIGGLSISNDSDVTGNHGSFDYWVVKLSSSGIVAVHDAVNQDFSIYPNPVTTEINIELHPGIEAVAIEMYNVFGQLILNIPVQTHSGTRTHTIAVSELPAGTYFVRLKTGHGNSIHKLLKVD
jgi:Secretion system C-terminal sorting domain